MRNPAIFGKARVRVAFGVQAGLCVVLAGTLMVPRIAWTAPPCEFTGAAQAYAEVQDFSLSDDRRVELAVRGLADSQECPESAAIRQGLAVVLLNTSAQSMIRSEQAAGRSAWLCDAVRSVQGYRVQREASGAPSDPVVEAKFRGLIRDQGMGEVCGVESQHSPEVVARAPAIEARPAVPLTRKDVRAGVGLMVLGALGMAVGGGLSAAVSSAEQDRRTALPGGLPCTKRSSCSELADRGERLELAQWVVYGVASGVLVAGLVALGVGLGKHHRQGDRGARRVSFDGMTLRLKF